MKSKVLLPLTVSLALLAGCGESFEQGFEREFVSACAAKNVSKTVCQCMFSELHKDYSILEMTLWNIKGVPKQAVGQAALVCTGQKT